ncbi:unnamed protein product [Cuscuta campestris]|uniref:Pectate lyase superfamily protein domain-containing protein n=1 Tax=Cuscuta campestris TaxID=132261 RepID=A0A484L2J5_9ASTE|nr:unnamed protein product [Cuscuta campestris]
MSYFLVLSKLLVFLVVFAGVNSLSVHGQSDVFEVSDFGVDTSGDIWDITQALEKAWRRACDTKDGIVLIPRGTFLLNTVTLDGPCNGSTTLLLNGDLKAPVDPSAMGEGSEENWVLLRNVQDLFVTGKGSFDGQGAKSWLRNECKRKLDCISLPTSLNLDNVTNAFIEGITSLDSKFFHIAIRRSESIVIKNVLIQAPEFSHNTDGIHISKSNHITIHDSDIGTGDDCISLSQGSRNIHIYRVRCGPGHGISIGSLGNHANEEDVTGILVNNCTFTNTTNGARIKTWAPSFHSRVSNLTFEDIALNNVSNPILIDQHYCPNSHCASKGESEVQISYVDFHNFKGTSPDNVSVTLNCSACMPCEAIVLGELDISHTGGGPTTSACANVHGTSYGSVSSIACGDEYIAPTGDIGMAPRSDIAPSDDEGHINSCSNASIAPSPEDQIPPSGGEHGIIECNDVKVSPSGEVGTIPYDGFQITPCLEDDVVPRNGVGTSSSMEDI